MSTLSEPEETQLKLSRILTLVEVALTRKPITLLVLAPLTLYFPDYLVARFWPEPPEAVFSLSFAWWSLQVLPAYSITALFHAWIAFQLYPDEQGPRSQLAYILVRILPLAGTSMLVGLGVTIGAVAFLIPGVIFGLACTVAIPAAAIERINPVAAIRRSIRLTMNRLWAIFGYGIVVMLPLAAIAFALELSFVDWNIRRIDSDPFVNDVLKPITSTVFTAINAALSAAFYFELVRLAPAPQSPTQTVEP